MARFAIDSRAAPIDFEAPRGYERTIQNVKNLMMCRMGEVPYDRRRGIDPAIFDMGLIDAGGVVLQEVTRVLGWEPDARAVSATVSLDENGETVITAIVEITG